MSSDVQLRRHQTQAVRQPTVTQRLSEILRRRRLRIGSRSASASGHTASSISDSLTLSESNTHSAAHRNVRWELADIVSLYESEIMIAIRGAAPAACSEMAAPSPSRAASRAWASDRPRAARARWPRWPPCPPCPDPAPARDTKGREVRETVSRSAWYDLCPNLLTSVWIPLLHYRTVWTFPLTRSPGAWSELGISLWLVRMNIWPLRHFYDLIAG